MGAGVKMTETGLHEGLSLGRPLVIQQRNLHKSDLRGVIFGCTLGTISECLNKQLFGLPSAHINYVQNIEPGLPLFLFNYSNRTLLGVYEAASQGQMNIDPHGWTKNGKQRTQFPAQVRIRIKMLCQPMTESCYRHIIKDNYYSAKHFYFELDHMQVDGLLSLFASVPPSESVICLSHMEDDNNMLILSAAEKWDVNQYTDARKISQNPEEETEVVPKLEKLQIDDSISPMERMQPEHPSNKGKLIFNEELCIEVDETSGTSEGICGTSKLFPEVCDDKDAIMTDSHCGVEVHKHLVPIVKGLMVRISILEKKQGP